MDVTLFLPQEGMGAEPASCRMVRKRPLSLPWQRACHIQKDSATQKRAHPFSHERSVMPMSVQWQRAFGG